MSMSCTAVAPILCLISTVLVPRGWYSDRAFQSALLEASEMSAARFQDLIDATTVIAYLAIWSLWMTQTLTIFTWPTRLNLLYLSAQLPQWQAVAGTIVVKSSNSLRINWRGTGRPIKGLRNVHNRRPRLTPRGSTDHPPQ